MPTPPIRGNGFVCKCRSEAGGTSRPRATAVFCTQKVMTIDMAKETIKLHTKRITAPSPYFPGRGLYFGKLNLRDSGDHVWSSRTQVKYDLSPFVRACWELDWNLKT